MILNAYAVLDAFVTLLRLILAAGVIGMAVSAWRRCARSLAPEKRRHLEDRFYLLFMLAFLLLALNIASWPLLYLQLQSYVQEWPEAMCIYGVTQIGLGSLGVGRFLPGLVRTLELTKPALVFCTGSWFVLYLVNRRTETAPLLSRILLALIIVGVLAGADAAVETLYLFIPKKEEFLPTGCCTTAFGIASRAWRFLPPAMVAEQIRPALWAGYYLLNGVTVLALAMHTVSFGRTRARGWLAFALLCAVISAVVFAVFLIEIAAPTLLRLPYHNCVYDLIPKVPESMVAIGLFVLGTFSVWWACVLAWCANCPETSSFLPQEVRRLALVALFAYVGSVVMISVELALG
jgi:hypothetical protein